MDAGAHRPSRRRHRADRQRGARGVEPVAEVVQARERHVRRADHDRHHPVGEAADHRGHDHEEDHDEAVAGRERVVHGLAGVDGAVALHAVDHRGQTMEDLNARLGKLPAHHNGQKAADDAGHDREDQVERSDILVVC